jgi:dipeptidyl-peptidase 4
MPKRILSAAMAGSMLSAVPVAAQDVAPKAIPLTLERVFASPSINGQAPRSVKLSPDGKYVTSLRPRADDRERFDLWAMDNDTGEWRMLVDSSKMGTSGALSEAEKMQRERARIGGTKGIVAYDWAPDGKSILVPLDGDIFLAQLDGSSKRLTNSATGELDATISSTGKYVSFVRDQNLVTLEIATEAEVVISQDGGGNVSYGVAEFVAQEEMDRTRGHWWSPNDAYIAYARVDEGGVKVATRAAIGADGTRVYEQRYPFAGTDNAKVDLYVFRAKGRSSIKVDLGSNTDYYIARVDWMPDGKALIVQRQSRDQKRLDVLKVDPATGASSLLFSEKAKTWLNLNDNLKFLLDGSMLWTSERDGYNHIYHIKNDKWKQLTKGAWAVQNIVGYESKVGKVLFTGNKIDPKGQMLLSVDLKGGEVTPSGERGWWYNVTMNRAGNRGIFRRSSPNQPEQVYLGNMWGQPERWIEENKLDATHPYAPYLVSHTAPQFGVIKAVDGTELQTKLLLPKMDPGKRYPVFVQVYGGPGAGRQVTQAWGGALQQYLVSQGWIVFSVDGRGTPDRGKAFEDHIYRAMGSVEVADQLAGVAWLKSRPFVDPKKITVYGWSYGGYMTLKLLQAAPGTFAAGVSGAPVTKWELYDSHYTERYMGDPREVPAAYAKSNAVTDAAKIADPLLLIHGMADDNVVFDHSTQLMAAMQEAAVPFETMVYPGQTHKVGGPKVSVHLWTSILNFLERNVKNKD